MVGAEDESSERAVGGGGCSEAVDDDSLLVPGWRKSPKLLALVSCGSWKGGGGRERTVTSYAA